VVLVELFTPIAFVPHSRNTACRAEAERRWEHATRVFLFPRPPLFNTLLISFAHQTTFFKNKKTYGNVFGGTDSLAATSTSKNLENRSKMGIKTASRPLRWEFKKRKSTNSHREKSDF
jgi:hypothetical protein